jgi:hypothetical protein
MSACSPCRSGTAPGKSLVSLPGNDVCNPCTGNTYRPASSTRWAAREAWPQVQPPCWRRSARGWAAADAVAAPPACSPTCLVCTAGRETESSGHAACMPWWVACRWHAWRGAVVLMPALLLNSQAALPPPLLAGELQE